MKDYKHILFEDVEQWCIENGKVQWLVEELEKTVEKKVYPRIKVTKPDGKVVAKADKSQKPTIIRGPQDFITIKRKWALEFMPEILPVAKEKKPTMQSKAAKLRAKYL